MCSNEEAMPTMQPPEWFERSSSFFGSVMFWNVGAWWHTITTGFSAPLVSWQEVILIRYSGTVSNPFKLHTWTLSLCPVDLLIQPSNVLIDDMSRFSLNNWVVAFSSSLLRLRTTYFDVHLLVLSNCHRWVFLVVYLSEVRHSTESRVVNITKVRVHCCCRWLLRTCELQSRR